MKTVFVLFDSLNRLALGAYGGTAVATPNFDRFARRGVRFDKHYAGSLPCIPARRDMHTGRLNFMHRSWGPLEPFDDSFPRILSENGIYTHLVTDHLHYFEDGGWGYANAFDSWAFVRGQEYDAIKPVVTPPVDRYREKFDPRHYPLEDTLPGKAMTRFTVGKNAWKKSRAAISHDFLEMESDYPTAKCFAAAFDFLDLNKEADNWFLQLECFDPHEPFVVPERFRAAYASGFNGKILDWPEYEKVANSEQEIAEIRANYAALVAMCDDYFGKLLDYFDENDLWKDTALVLTTDHGFLLGEHEFWGKNRTPYYEEIAHIPMIVWHPEHAGNSGKRSNALTQSIDLMPTFLDFFGCDTPADVIGQSILPYLMMSDDLPERTVAIGMFGGPICVTDGRYSYFRYPEDVSAANLNLYTLMPAHLSRFFALDELSSAELVAPFSFTKGVPVMRVRMNPANTQVGNDGHTLVRTGNALYDLMSDPGQEHPIEDAEQEARMIAAITSHFRAHEAPAELYEHFGLTPAGGTSIADAARRDSAAPVKG